MNSNSVTEIKIQKAIKSDILDLSNFSKKTFQETFIGTCTDEDLQNFCEETYHPIILEKEIKDPSSEVFLIYFENSIIAYIKINFDASLPLPETGKGMEIQRLYVDKEFLGNKLGKKLMDFAEKLARDKKTEKIWLGVWELNERAKRFYEGLGFNYFGSHPFPIGNTPQTDLWMSKTLLYL